jgi:hypothetical protein
MVLFFPEFVHVFQSFAFGFRYKFPDEQSGQNTHQSVYPVCHSMIESIGKKPVFSSIGIRKLVKKNRLERLFN